jgi:hypothetical protein
MPLVGDFERERAAAALRRHYLQGRLSAEELAARLQLALGARHSSELKAALEDLPNRWRQLEQTSVQAVSAASRAAGRAALVLLLASFWSLVSLVLLAAFTLTLLVHGASLTSILGFPLAWLLFTLVLWNAGRRISRGQR